MSHLNYIKRSAGNNSVRLRFISADGKKWKMKKYFYAVRKGRSPGIYLTWEACRKEVAGFSGAVYKKFESREEAEKFVNSPVLSETDICTPGDDSENSVLIKERPAGAGADSRRADQNFLKEITGENSDFHENALKSYDVVAYVDGSFDRNTKRFGSGAVIFFDGRKYEFSQPGDDPDLACMHNVAGEIKGAEKAFRFAAEHGAHSLLVIHDYEGIRAWCTGEWKAKKKGTSEYRDIYKKYSENVQINFCKVRGHSGNKYNDEADSLAKKAAGIKQTKGNEKNE